MAAERSPFETFQIPQETADVVAGLSEFYDMTEEERGKLDKLLATIGKEKDLVATSIFVYPDEMLFVDFRNSNRTPTDEYQLAHSNFGRKTRIRGEARSAEPKRWKSRGISEITERILRELEEPYIIDFDDDYNDIPEKWVTPEKISLVAVLTRGEPIELS